jgi:mono/diheme cytochrome c family protein
MAMVSSTKIRTMNVNARQCGGVGFVPDDDDYEEVIKTSRVALSVTKRQKQTMKSILGVSLLVVLIPSAYAAELPGDSADGKRLHDANCMGCHDTGIYTRKDSFSLWTR